MAENVTDADIPTTPLIMIGLVTDLHYASKPYGNRYCDESLLKLKQSVETFQARSLDLVINAGDSIDTGATIAELLRSGFAMRKSEKLSNAQMILAANAPILARIAMSDGDPSRGYLPSGTVAGVIEDRPTCDELVARIVNEAERTLKKLCP